MGGGSGRRRAAALLAALLLAPLAATADDLGDLEGFDDEFEDESGEPGDLEGFDDEFGEDEDTSRPADVDRWWDLDGSVAVSSSWNFIEHRSALNGAYVAEKPRCVLVGAGMSFKAAFKIPKRKKSLIFKYSVWRPPDLNEVREKQMAPKAVYEQLATSGFERFRKKYLASIFAKP